MIATALFGAETAILNEFLPCYLVYTVLKSSKVVFYRENGCHWWEGKMTKNKWINAEVARSSGDQSIF